MSSAPRLATGAFLRLWASAFAFFFAFYLLLPTLPLYARTLGIPESLTAGALALAGGALAAIPFRR